jgi:hypothetical protein
MNWLNTVFAAAKYKFVKVCRYYWYATNLFEGEDQQSPLWATQYANSVILYFNNLKAAEDSIQSASIGGGWVNKPYKNSKIQPGSRLFPRVVRVIFHN